jgi:CYTH domain-containing protein
MQMIDFKTYLAEKFNEDNEYDNEGGMSKGQLKTMIDAAQELHDMLDDAENMPEWVQSKITKATDYIDTARDYMKSKNVNEGSETWEDGYDRRVVKTTDPDHKKDGHNWRIKGKDKANLSIKLYKEKPSQAEFNKQMKRVAGHEFGGR